MKTSDFDYYLPPELIAQSPCEPRDHSRLLVLNRSDGSIEHRRFFQIADFLREGDVLVFNDSRVIPARLAGRKADSGGKVEILLLRRLDTKIWEALVKPGKRLHIGSRVKIMNNSTATNQPETLAEVAELKQDGVKVIRFSNEGLLSKLGKIPLPPYIHAPLANPERYQTVYARVNGSAAAPTAGLHFTRELLGAIEGRGVNCRFVSLHIGLDTFRPVREDDPTHHPIYREYGVLSEAVANELSQAKREGRRVICVGTTATRIVEHVAWLSNSLDLQPFEGWVNLFILPGYHFRMADAMVTNFHLPRSTLLMLVTAFAGKELVKKAYQDAIDLRYRFYSFGDAMLVL